MSSKLSLLLPLLWRRPREFLDRLTAIVDVKSEEYLYHPPGYQSSTLQAAIRNVDQSLGWKVAAYIAEAACQRFTQQIKQAIAALPANAPFSQRHNSDFTLAHICYAFCRMLKPQVVVETGVAYGVTSSFILAALDENQAGKLYSIDLPPLGNRADDFVGTLVPANLRSRWQLMRGTSRRLLPELVASVAPIDLFIHDSLHTHRNITFELDTVMPRLNRPAGVLVDDAGHNSAFAEWQPHAQPTLSQVVRKEKENVLFAFAIFD
jgi:predicted O-methyltransferase YrrM